jgi:hypothetical protein
VYASECLSFGRKGKVPRGKSYCRQPDSGKPTVRDEKGAEQKRGLWRHYDPAAHIERVRVGNPSPKVARAALLPDGAADKAAVQQVSEGECPHKSCRVNCPDSDT